MYSAELDSFDEKFATEEFAGYAGTSALRAKVASGEITAFKAETTARKEINALKLAEQNALDKDTLDALLYDEDFSSAQETRVYEAFEKSGLAGAKLVIAKIIEDNAYVAPVSSGGGYVAPVTPVDPVGPPPGLVG